MADINEIISSNPDAFTGIENAADTVAGINKALEAIGYSSLYHSNESPEFIDVGKLTAADTRATTAEGQLAPMKAQLTKVLELIGADGKADVIEAVNKLVTDLTDSQGNIDKLTLDGLVEKGIEDTFVNKKTGSKLIDRSKLSVVDGKLIGLQEQLDVLKVDDESLFAEIGDGTGGSLGNRKRETKKGAGSVGKRLASVGKTSNEDIAKAQGMYF